MLNNEKNKIQSPYRVPEGYFDQLELNLSEFSSIDSKLNQKHYPPSESYFEDLESEVTLKIKLNRKNKPKTDGFYFESLEKEILKNTIPKKPDPFIYTIKHKVFKYAATVFITAGIGYSIYIQNNTSKIDDLSNSEMIAYLNEQNLENEDIETLADIVPTTTEIMNSEINIEDLEAYQNEIN